MLSTKDNAVYNIHIPCMVHVHKKEAVYCLRVVMVLDSQTICFQFVMQIGNI